MERTYNYLLLNKKLFKSLFLGFIVFTLIKVVFITRFGNFATFKNFYTDIPHMIFNSVRFDLQSLAYIFALFLVVNLFSLVFKSEKNITFINNLSIKLIPVFLTISILILFADQQFYSFFKLHFNSVAFDFFDEEPKLLLKSIWVEHPVIRILLFTVLLYLIIRFYIRRIYKNTQLKIDKLNLISRILVSIILLGFYFLLIRGSVGTFPLQNEDTNVSENEFINACVPNALFSLKEAYQESKKEFKISAPDQILKAFKYNSLKEAFADLRDVPIDSIKSDNIDDLIFTSVQGTQEKKYNVVLFIMESMSNHLINFHNKDCNLLGSFESHFQQDIVFRDFQSAGNGTIITLENMIINAPFHNIFETKYRFKPYDISIAKPFKDAGYETSFITGIELGWRHLDEVMKQQYFDQVYGKNYILNNSPGSESNNTWGVYDHDVFDFIFNVLSESDSAQFITTLSSTNHTPYELPEDYNPYLIDPKIAENPAFSVPKERCLEVLSAFQYSNNALGLFMDKIKNSPLAENTIVIITGDHNNRSAISYNTPELQKLKYSVPLYIYMPDDLREKLYIDTSRKGSHYDIMTSIFPYILNNIKFLNVGQDLFSDKKPSEKYYSINDEQLLYGDSLSKEDVEKKVRARNAILFYYYSTQINKKDNFKPE